MESTGSDSRHRRLSRLLALGCFLAIFGAKCLYVDRFASSLPNWDQWDAESEFVFVPYLRGELAWTDLFKPHNEHRIVPTKLVGLGLLLANGHWDARLECVVNALLQTLIALGVFLIGRRAIPARAHGPWLVSVLVFFGAPMSWQNATGGFHTQQAFLILSALGSIHLLVDARMLSARWWAGIATALAALVTMGSGLLAAVAAGATLVFTTPLRSVVRRHGATLALLVAIACLGWFTRVEVGHHNELQARSAGDFFLSFWRSLQWPVRHFPLFPLLAWAPFGWLALRVWRAKDQGPAVERVAFGAGVWVLLQFAASAYARGAGGDWPAVRYLDTLAIGLAVNALAALIAFTRVPLPGWRHAARVFAAVLAGVLLTHGLVVHFVDATRVTGFALIRDNAEKEARTRSYLRTGDEAHLRSGTIPYPSATTLLQRISHEEIRARLPAIVRRPLPMAPETDSPGGFGENAVAPGDEIPQGWSAVGSFGPQGAASTGSWRSQLIQPGSDRYWMVPVFTTDPADPELSLWIEDASGAVLSTLLPGKVESRPLGSWGVVHVRAPDVPARLVAGDRSARGWLAFGEPVEHAAGSRWAERVAGAGGWVFWSGLSLAAISLALSPPLLAQMRRLAPSEGWRIRGMTTWRLGATALVCGVIAGGLAYYAVFVRQPAYLEVRVGGELRDKSIELYYDLGRGIRPLVSVQVFFNETDTKRPLRLRIPPGRIRALRLDPMDAGRTLTLTGARLVDATGRVIQEFPPGTFTPVTEIASATADGDTLRVTSVPGAIDPQLYVRFRPALSTALAPSGALLGRFVTVGLVALLGAVLGPPMLRRGRMVAGQVAGRIRKTDSASPPPTANEAINERTPVPTSPGHAAVLSGVALLLIAILAVRKTHSFVTPQFWSADGAVFFVDAVTLGLGSLLREYEGFIHVIPRLLALVGSWAEPGALPVAFVLLSLGFAVASVLHLFSPRVALPWKPALAAAVFLLPHSGEVYLNVMNTPVFVALLLVQLAIKQPWTTTSGKVADVGLLIACGLTGPYSIVVTPLFAWRAWRSREAADALKLGIIAACAATQLSFGLQAAGALAPGNAAPLNLPILGGVIAHRWILGLFTGGWIPGASALAGVTAGAALVGAALLACTLRRDALREPRLFFWWVAIALVAVAAWQTRMDQWLFGDLANGDRYFFVPKVLLAWLVILEAHERSVSGWIARGLLVLALVAGLGAFRFPAPHDYRWQDYSDAIRRGEPAVIPIPPEGWTLHYPGRPGVRTKDAR